MATLLDALCAAAPVGAIAVEDAESVEMMFQKAAAAADEAASQLMIVLDYDLTISKATTAECHHMLRDASALPAGFRDDVNTLFAARDPTHARHTEIYGMESDADRPHRFWLHYNNLLVKHRVTQRMIDEAVAEEKARHGSLLRNGVADLLALCDAAGILVVILSAGLEQVIRAAFAHDGVELPSGCRLLTNTLVFEDAAADQRGGGGACIRVEPVNPPASREGKIQLLRSLDASDGRTMVLMVGDKPVDARVARGLPPCGRAASDGTHGAMTADRPRVELAFGFFNQQPSDSAVPVRLSDWQAAFHLLAHNGNECGFAPVTELVRQLMRAGTLA